MGVVSRDNLPGSLVPVLRALPSLLPSDSNKLIVAHRLYFMFDQFLNIITDLMRKLMRLMSLAVTINPRGLLFAGKAS